MATMIVKGREVLVDDDNFAFLSKYNWNIKRTPSGKCYIRTRMCGKPVDMHTAVMASTDEVDHKNGNTFDNRRDNLRPSTHSQNMRNSGKKRGAWTSRFKGVSRIKDRSSVWEARIATNGRRKNLGRFPCEITAAACYDLAARAIHKEFASGNFTDDELRELKSEILEPAIARCVKHGIAATIKY